MICGKCHRVGAPDIKRLEKEIKLTLSSNLKFVQESIVLNDHVREGMIGLQHQLVTGPGRVAMGDIPLALAIISRETGQ